MHHFYYSDQWQVLEERVGSITTADRQYVWGMRYVDDLVLFDKGSTRHYSLQDANWNVVAMVDDAGAIQERYAYTPYGTPEFLNGIFVPHSTQESDIDNEYLYTGRRLDPESGLQLNRNRFYASHLGRWVNRDPIGYDAGPNNLYAYVGGMPTRFEDPTGFAPWPGLMHPGGPNGELVPVLPLPRPPKNYFVCRRIVDEGGDSGQRTARACGSQHTAIYGDYGNGEVYDGWFWAIRNR